MTDLGDYILIESSQVGNELPAILKAVEEGHRRVRIVRNGKTVAEVSPVIEPRLLPTQDPDLKVTFSPEYDPQEGLSEDDWPEHLR